MSINKFLSLGLLFVCNIFFLSAQEDAKYLAGAVPLVDGKVVFEREVRVDSSISSGKLLELAEQWAKEEFEAVDKKYEGSNQRILMKSETDHYLVIQGDEKFVFTSKLLYIDQTIITYQLIVQVAQGKCTLTMRNIKYEYQDYDDLMPAEEMIADKQALHKSGEKLNRHYDKFRRFTIDRVDALADSFKDYIEKATSKTATVSEDAPVAEKPAVVKASPVIDFSMSGYKKMNASELSEDVLKMIKDSWTLIVVETSEDKWTAMTALWSGLGNFGGKSVAMVISKNGIEADNVYTISFYNQIHKSTLDEFEKGAKMDLTSVDTPSGGAAFSEAWLIIECKKSLEQPATEAMVKDAQSRQWAESKDFDKLFMGEIIGIWAR